LATLLDPFWQKFLLSAMLAGLLVAGLRPFYFFPKNQISWLPDGPGILFHGHSQIVAPSPLGARDHANAATAPPEMTLELWLSSLSQGPVILDLLSVYVSREREPFAVEQWDRRLVVAGLFRDGQGHRQFSRVGVDDVFATGARRFITVTSGPAGTKIYLEGVLKDDSPRMTIENENFDGTLLLGQTAIARQEWRGVMLGLAFYDKQLSPDDVAANYAAWRRGDTDALKTRAPGAAIYPFNESQGVVVNNRGNLGSNLDIPRRLRAIDPEILELPSWRDLTDVSDVVTNILGFVPFGFLLVLFLKRSRRWSNGKAAGVAIAIGFTVSLVIELLQVFLPSRDSSMLDLINNTLGTAIGAGLGMMAWPRLLKIWKTAN
jgi:hypothetical protein